MDMPASKNISVLFIEDSPHDAELAQLALERSGYTLHTELVYSHAGVVEALQRRAFDLILANPPYLVDPGERTYRHGGGPLGAGLSLAIVDAALARLAPGGTLLLYTGVAMLDNADPFLAAVRERLEGRDFSWRYREMDPDVFGEELLEGAYTACDRIAAVVLEVTRPLADG